MKRKSWVVGDHGVRPNGPPDECFYCQAKVGTEHVTGCVIRSRTVVAKATIEIVMSIPEDWTAEDFYSRHTDGTYCLNNLADTFSEMVERLNAAGACACDMAQLDYVREAEPGDEKQSQMFVDILES